MKKLLALALAVALTSTAAAKVWTRVYRCDGVTPLQAIDPNQPNTYRDIMVGTRLVLVISSDVGEPWLGQLRLSWEDANDARLSGRGFLATRPGSVAKYPNYVDSSLAAAGRNARVRDVAGSRGIGLELTNGYTRYVISDHPAVAGDWFIVDYYAEQVGSCEVGLYELSVSLDVPTQTLSFTHVPSRDFNADTLVNLRDFALLASHWQLPSGPESGSPTALDLDQDGRIDVADIALFSERWLERTDHPESPPEPNNPAQP